MSRIHVGWSFAAAISVSWLLSVCGLMASGGEEGSDTDPDPMTQFRDEDETNESSYQSAVSVRVSGADDLAFIVLTNAQLQTQKRDLAKPIAEARFEDVLASHGAIRVGSCFWEAMVPGAIEKVLNPYLAEGENYLSVFLYNRVYESRYPLFRGGKASVTVLVKGPEEPFLKPPTDYRRDHKLGKARSLDSEVKGVKFSHRFQINLKGSPRSGDIEFVGFPSDEVDAQLAAIESSVEEWCNANIGPSIPVREGQEPVVILFMAIVGILLISFFVIIARRM
ncbi:MAG: hypothetical protein AAF191_05310 [Verrucomicrobiota bacterium]